MKHTKIAFIAAAVALAMAPTAFASGIGNTYNQPSANASTGPITNAPVANGGTAIAAPVINSNPTATATGGTGGQGGNASVFGSGNSSNLNTNTNANLQGQQQGQGQGQIATGGAAAGGSASAGSSSNSSSNSGGNQMTQVGGAHTSTQANSVTVTGDTVTYQAQERNPVSSAFAAPLAASNGTCMGSTSAGAQGVSFGMSFGTTWTDTGCDARYDAQALSQLGMRDAANARLCQKPEIAKAMEAAGTPCKGAKVAAAPTAPTAAPVERTAWVAPGTVQPQYTDPIVRARLGLPPLK